jgi:hypothetical protein
MTSCAATPVTAPAAIGPPCPPSMPLAWLLLAGLGLACATPGGPAPEPVPPGEVDAGGDAPGPDDPDGPAEVDAEPLPPPPPAGGPYSTWVYPGPDGKLVYKKDGRGNQVPDFSNAGYGGGGVALPSVPVAQTLGPAEAGDDGPRIQAAIDALAALPPDDKGFRGALLLTKGLYRIATNLLVNASGIVLRGEGQGTDGTVLLATGATQRSLVQLRGSGGLAEVMGSRRTITDDYVPVGARSFQVDDAAGFAVGDTVVVHRPTTQAWVDFVGMDSCLTVDTPYDKADVNGSTCLDNPWAVGSKDLRFDRVITAVEGNRITVDAPILNALEKEFGGGTIYKYSAPGRISQVAVENLRGDSEFVAPDDELHGWNFVEIRNATNAWVRDITAIHYGYAAVTVVGNSKWVTVQDSTSLEPVSQITGGRRYTWNVDDAQMVLFQRCTATTGRHDFVQGSNVPGPNVFLAGTALDARDDIGPHHRWSAGGLYDGIVSNRSIRIRNRGNSGTGHGWAGNSIVVWNSKAPTILVQNPPGAQNWAIGCESAQMGDGIWDAVGTPVTPKSLYLQQLEDRLGPAAVQAIAR